ncbi:MAG TPA: hypothetical protein VGO91_14720 [Pyrinomonadaceae bacterium]|nr:hypothetical protein [Pyrinomonadaceae bacterium]
MKVYLLRFDDERTIFYSEGPETPLEDESAQTPARAGVRGWAERKYRSLQTTINSAESGVGLRMKRAWEWLQQRASPDEALLRSLRNVEMIHLYHPSQIDAAEARNLWTNYLKGRRRHHSLWLVLNALVTPLTVLLAPIPGPNIIGYWFLYRAICHLLAVLGVRRALGEGIETEFLSSGVLDDLLEAGDEERLSGVAERLDLKGLEAFMKRAARARGERRKATLAVS